MSPEEFDLLLSLVNEDIRGQPGFRLHHSLSRHCHVTPRNAVIGCN